MRSEEQKAKMMTELARSFPALDSKFDDAQHNGLDPWDFLTLSKCSIPWSSTEKMVVSFLATVWNVYDAKTYVEPFCIVEASTTFDKANWDAVAKWISNPFTC